MRNNDVMNTVVLRMLAEQIKYLHDKSRSGSNDDLIRQTKEAYVRISNQVGVIETEEDAND